MIRRDYTVRALAVYFDDFRFFGRWAFAGSECMYFLDRLPT